MSLLDFIFPKNLYCISCGRPLPFQIDGDVALCERCVNDITWISGRTCEKCGRPLSEENPKDLCHDCIRTADFVFEKVYACALYSGKVAEIIREMKYRSKAWYADTVAALMVAKYLTEADMETGELPSYDFVVPVPMSPMKKARRGYDQADLIAIGFSRRTGIPILRRVLERTRDTNVMSGLSEWERKINLEAAFSVSYDNIDTLTGKKLLLVDDVYTTGSSVNACAEVLLATSANSVSAIVFAIGADVRHREDRPAVVESPGQLRAKGPT